MSTIEQAYAIASEVASYSADIPGLSGADVEWSAALDSTCAATGPGSVLRRREAVGELLSGALSDSHKIAKWAQSPIEPRGAVCDLTARTLALTAFAGEPDQLTFDRVLDNCCFGAELKFVHNLQINHSGKRPESGRNAALVLLDNDDEPFAYQKAYGHPYAFAWRNSRIRTQAGLRQVPAGAILRPLYNQGSDAPPPHVEYAGKGLVGITDTRIDDVVFMRFGAQIFSRALCREVLLDASSEGAYSQYRAHVAETVDMDNAAFGRRVMDLLNKGLVFWTD
jgi:hypothetical protein